MKHILRGGWHVCGSSSNRHDQMPPAARAPARPSTAGDRTTRKVPSPFHVKRGGVSRLVLCGAEAPCLGLGPGSHPRIPAHASQSAWPWRKRCAYALELVRDARRGHARGSSPAGEGRSLGTCWNGCVRTHTVRAEAISLPTHRPSCTWDSCSTVLLEHCLARAVLSLLSYYPGPAISEITSRSA